MWLAIAHRSPSLIIYPLISSFSLFPPCLSVFAACHFIHPCTCHQPLALRMKWWGALRQEERRSNLTPSLCISEAASAAERHGLMRRKERIEGTGKCFRKSRSASRRCILTFYSRLGSLRHIAILSLSLTVFNYLSSAISVVSHLLRDAPLWNSASTSFTFDFLVFSTLRLSIHFAACHNIFFFWRLTLFFRLSHIKTNSDCCRSCDQEFSACGRPHIRYWSCYIPFSP